MTPPLLTAPQDGSHLRLLSIFHYILSGVTALAACVPIIHVVIGVLVLRGEFGGHGGPPPAIGVLFLVLGSAFIAAGWVLAGLLFFAGRSLAQRRRWLFCQIVAGLSCLFFPLGTALGVFTLIVLQRPSVRQLFQLS